MDETMNALSTRIIKMKKTYLLRHCVILHKLSYMLWQFCLTHLYKTAQHQLFLSSSGSPVILAFSDQKSCRNSDRVTFNSAINYRCGVKNLTRPLRSTDVTGENLHKNWRKFWFSSNIWVCLANYTIYVYSC